MQFDTPAALAAYLRRTPIQAMKEAIEEYEAGYLTIGELESKLLFLVQREKDLSATRERGDDGER